MNNNLLTASYERTGNFINEKESVYKGEMLVTTCIGESCLIKYVYTKNSFYEGNILYLNPDAKDLTLQYDITTLKSWIEHKIISKEDGENLIEEITNEENKMQKFRKWLILNPNSSEEEQKSFFNTDIKNSSKYSTSLRKILSVKEIIYNFQKDQGSHALFSYNINHDTDFGISKPCAEGISNLPELLYTSTFEPIYDNLWRLSAKIKSNKKDLEITLEYQFLASSKEEANKMAEYYKDTLKKGGLKVLLAYWKKATDLGKITYTCALRDIMELCSSANRNSYYNMEERKRFWMLTRILENTKMSFPLTREENRRKKTVNVEHRFLEILNRSIEEEEGCPIEIKVRVIDNEVFAEQTQLATAIANNILSLDENDIMLAFSLEVRSSQRREHRGISVDNDYLFEKGNLSKTAEKNPRMAKKCGKEKLDRLKKAKTGLIDWQETSKNNYFIETIKRPKKEKKPLKI